MDLRQFHQVSKALADPQRFAMLERIGQSSEVACQALVGEFSVTQATISHHIKELIYAGLVEARREGKCAYFTLRRDVLDAFTEELRKRLGGEPVAARRTPPKRKLSTRAADT